MNQDHRRSRVGIDGPSHHGADDCRQETTESGQELAGIRGKEALLNKQVRSRSRPPYDSSELRLVDLRSLLNAAVQSALSCQTRGLGPRSNAIRIQTFVRGPSMIHGCLQDLQELFLNLILTALGAMPEGGDVYLTIEEHAGVARVYIQDNGQDRATAVLPGPFRGLDLNLCYAIVGRHRGEMDVRSQEGRGAMVVVQLPLAEADASTRTTVSKKALKDSHILVIGKDRVLAGLLQTLFADRVGRVSVTGSYREGRRVLKDGSADLIIADQNALPHDAGAMVRGLKAAWPEIPVVVINAAHAHAIDGADLLVPRPLDVDRFLLQINRLVGRGANPK